MKPWEETWTVEFEPYGGYDCMSAGYSVRRGYYDEVCCVDVEGRSHDEDPGKASLAALIAAAPEMARLLLVLLRDHKNCGCPWCSKLVAVLRKAGVLG